MSIQFKQTDSIWHVLLDGEQVLTIEVPAGCTDSFEPIGDTAFYWHRKTDKPVTQMRLTMKANYIPRYFQVPSVNYNGNGWGSGAQYYGYGDKDEPWTYAWHRVAIPACTYSESDKFAVALFGEEKGGMSCSIYPEGDQIVQELIWPEVEGPKVLFKRLWKEPYQGTMEPTDSFTGIVMLDHAGKPRQKMNDLLDFAWKLNYREVTMPYSPERVKELDLLYIRSMWHQRANGLTGFLNGVNWDEEMNGWKKYPIAFEIGWCGQNAAQACAMLDLYLETGDEDAKHKAITVLDSWDKHAFLPCGLMYTKLLCPPDHLDSIMNGTIPTNLDTCNLGTGATYFFRAAKLCKQAGIDRPSYEKRAFGLCDFFVNAQQESGEFAKTYFLDGTIDSPHGSVASFVIPPLFDAYELSGDKKYLDCAIKGLEFYLGEFAKGGCTTAGALDSNCIDKESGAPLIRATMRAYEVTKEQKYLDAAIELGYYLATWQWHYSIDFPADSLLGQHKVDSYGSTSVSAAHNALDHYGIYYIPEYLKLAELTGNDIWRQRARAIWYNGTQMISDGTLVVRGRVRPAGSQDESFRHTRWCRTDNRMYTPCEWCTVWQGTFRHVVQQEMDNWDVLR